MCALQTLYFPGTKIYSAQQYPMFLLPGTIHVLQPIEETPLSDELEPVDTFIKNDFCQAYTPAPLGENRGRFLHLIRDISERKDDYAAQLSQLTLAALSNPKKNTHESRGSIISTLIGSQGVTADPKEKTDAELWQARLVLVLAQMLEKEEEDLSRNLSILEDSEAAILQDLHGDESVDEENPFADLQQLKRSMVSAGSSSAGKRFVAWARLHHEEQSNLQYINTYLTDNQDCVELLLEKYLERVGTQAPILTTFSIPALTGWNPAEVVEAICTFRDEQAELLQKIETLITGTETVQDEIIEQWHSAIDVSFPADKFGRKTLCVYSFENCGCLDLLTGAAGTAGKHGTLIALTSTK